MAQKKTNKLRFLHCSDIHLDSPVAGLSAEKSEERRREVRNSFMRLMQYVRESNINVVLMSGDIFDTEYVTNTTAEVLVREFRNCPDTDFIISPGKHDHYTDNPIYTAGRLPSNCYVFNSDTLSRFDFQDSNVTVYGWAFMGDTMRTNPIIDRHVDDSSRVNILCAYVDLNGSPDSDSCPVSSQDLKRFGADFYALGSRHEAGRFMSIGASKYSYCGALECTGFDEPGLGGANLVTIEYSDGELTIDNKSVSFGHVRFKTETLDITGVNTGNEIINRISRMISDKKYDHETALCVKLVGSVEPRFSVPKNIESDAFGLYFFRLVDKTLPLYGTERFKRDMSVAGEIYRKLLPDMQSGDEERAQRAARAFRVALAALENRETEL